jgi:hypothetical protein
VAGSGVQADGAVALNGTRCSHGSQLSGGEVWRGRYGLTRQIALTQQTIAGLRKSMR